MEKKKLILLILSSAVVIAVIISAIIYTNSGNGNQESTVSKTTEQKESKTEISETSVTALTETDSSEAAETTTGKTTEKATEKTTGATAKNSTTAATNNTTAATSSPSTGAAQTQNSSFVQQVIELVNNERAKAGLSPVSTTANQANAASERAQEIVSAFSHTRPDGRSFSTVLAENGVSYSGAGENIAYGQTTPQQVMNSWMSSSGHKANILNANYKVIGVGYCQNASGTAYWTQLFVY